MWLIEGVAYGAFWSRHGLCDLFKKVWRICLIGEVVAYVTFKEDVAYVIYSRRCGLLDLPKKVWPMRLIEEGVAYVT